ncbi:LysM domain-containing protein [Halobacillus sp. BBL2006]|uniref:LysM peptidoglycan-binding domain-containing protein n=1 Tax=Halobacillus sp. BBL2006 TaxID=1543706 RepID=UPI0009DE4270|nr:LysM domain-containing protein [Halobacillus sp. BBL2006]
MSRADGYNKEFHTVKPGSTLYNIANLHKGVSVEDLLELNPNIDPFNLRVGQEIRVK